MKSSFWKAFSASVIGPAHIEAGLPNQDAVKTKITEQIAIAVVSDGVGSEKKADIGSKNACHAVLKSVELWVNSPSSEVNYPRAKYSGA